MDTSTEQSTITIRYHVNLDSIIIEGDEQVYEQVGANLTRFIATFSRQAGFEVELAVDRHDEFPPRPSEYETEEHHAYDALDMAIERLMNSDINYAAADFDAEAAVQALEGDAAD